jgi:hypothetical protein
MSCVARSFSPQVRRYLPRRFARIPADHLIAQALRQKALLAGRGRIPGRSGKSEATECEAFYFRDKVYAAFNVSSPTAATQLALF